MSEPTVTSTSNTHSAPISKPDPHSVAREEIPPESRPTGNDQDASQSNDAPGPNDSPSNAPGEHYPPQLHAGHVGLGPHYAEVHGKETGFAAKMTGFKEELKGKVTRNHDLEQRGHDRITGELKEKEQAEDEAKNPFKSAEDPEDHDEKNTDNDQEARGDKNTSNNQEAHSNEKHAEGTPMPPNAPRDTGVSPSHERH